MVGQGEKGFGDSGEVDERAIVVFQTHSCKDMEKACHGNRTHML
jgi:hypothetical protein